MTDALNLNALDDLLVDEDVFTEGRWVHPDPDRPLKIKTRGLNDAFNDAQTRMQRERAKGFNNDTKRIPFSQLRDINARCLVKHSLVDVRDCVIGGAALSFNEFCDLIQQPRGRKLLDLAFTAATMATEATAGELADAEGN